jgi:spermidine synthase
MASLPETVTELSRAELAVLVSGVTSMGLEILAGRVIAPEFGSSIYTWGSIIGVFLAALSLGYWRGGKRAAQEATHARLATLLGGSALYVVVLLLGSDYLMQVSVAVPVPARFAPLVPVTLLFGPPTYLLGVVSPYAAELSEKEGPGAASGHVYALGTIGSIGGAFATTFLLVPALSIQQTWLLFGGTLVGGALVVGSATLPDDARFGLVGVGALLVLAAVVGPLGPGVSGTLVYESQTAYQELQVVDEGDVRTLYLDGQRHSAMDREDPYRHVFEYTRYFHLPLLLTDDVDRVLFVGGGGFTGPKIFAERYDVTVDVVEIDPEVVDVAREYFSLEEGPDMNVHVGDGRQFLAETDHEYDLIVLDAYKKDKVPFQLTTVEFMELAKQHLTADGVLLANVISAPSGAGSKFFRAEYRTMQAVFPQVYAYRTSDSSFVQNVELVATRSERRVSTEQLRERNRRRDVGYNLSEEVANRIESVNTDDVPVLRDDRAPVDSLLDPMVGRKYVVEQRGDNASAPAVAPRAPSVRAT